MLLILSRTGGITPDDVISDTCGRYAEGHNVNIDDECVWRLPDFLSLSSDTSFRTIGFEG